MSTHRCLSFAKHNSMLKSSTYVLRKLSLKPVQKSGFQSFFLLMDGKSNQQPIFCAVLFGEILNSFIIDSHI